MKVPDEANDAPAFRDALRAVQQLVKAARLPLKGGEARGTWITDADESQARLAAYDKALVADPPELVRRATDALRERRQSEDAAHARLIQTRTDVDRRRKEIAAAVGTGDWPLEHRETRDELGPFTILHRADSTTVKLGAVKLGVLRFPTGEQVVRAVRLERTRLESAARSLWPDFRDRLVPLQQATDDGVVSWAEAVRALSSDDAPFRRREAVALLLLATLRGPGIDGWHASFRAPTLAQQNAREAVSVPRIDRPGHADRISGLRLEAPAAAAGGRG